MTDTNKKRVAVIGAGLGGLSAAVSLAAMGYAVEMFEKNDRVGGKLNQLKKEGFTFDLGPSILTLPHLFRRLWERAGKRMEDYMRVTPVTPHWRNFFEDGTVIDLYMAWDEMKAEAVRIGGERLARQIAAFLAYAKSQYRLVERGYFEQGLDTKGDFTRFYDWRSLLRMDYWHSMHGGVRKRIKNRYFIDIFDYFIKYVGSSAYRAPGFMNLMPTIQFEYDLWYVEGGMYRLAEALKRLAEESGVRIHVNAEITRIDTQGERVTGVVDHSGTGHAADVVVSNMEVIPAYERLLDEDACFLKTLQKFEPACSGLVLHIGTDRPYPQLAHHNFFYARDQKKHFDTVFNKKEVPEDPTLYVVAPSRSDNSVCPPGCDNIKVLPHIPYLHPRHRPDQ
ncbi:MAG: phytoene desaturase family protein, partial [bacterium]